MEGSSELQKFAEELHWCISQLELGLQRQSPDSRQAAETIKVLKILRSTKAPMVKKRQAMRNALGDYRKKMKDAEKKSLTSLRHSKFQPMGNMKSSTKSRFLRQSHSKQQHANIVRSELNTNFHNLHLQQEGDDSQNSTLTSSSSLGDTSNNASTAVSSSSQRGESNLASDAICSPNVTPSAMSPTNALIGINGRGNTSQTSDCVHSIPSCSLTNQAERNFKFVPSDNSFTFGFENSDSRDEDDSDMNINSKNDKDNSGIGNGDVKYVDGSKTSGSSETNDLISRKNFYKFEKSSNDFVFGFGQPEFKKL